LWSLLYEKRYEISVKLVSLFSLTLIPLKYIASSFSSISTNKFSPPPPRLRPGCFFWTKMKTQPTKNKIFTNIYNAKVPI
jgi:hypothetical protein